MSISPLGEPALSITAMALGFGSTTRECRISPVCHVTGEVGRLLSGLYLMKGISQGEVSIRNYFIRVSELFSPLSTVDVPNEDALL